MNFIRLAALAAFTFASASATDPTETFFCNTFVRPNGYSCVEYQCSVHIYGNCTDCGRYSEDIASYNIVCWSKPMRHQTVTTTYDGYILNLQRVTKGTGSPAGPPPPSSPPDLSAQITAALGPLIGGLPRSRISTSTPPAAQMLTSTRSPPSKEPPADRPRRRSPGVSHVSDSVCDNRPGIDYYGNDLPPSALGGISGGLPSPSVSDCCVKCQTHTGCKAYSWRAQGESGRCYPKSVAGNSRPQSGVTGGMIRVTDPTSVRIVGAPPTPPSTSPHASTSRSPPAQPGPPKANPSPPAPSATPNQPPPPPAQYPVLLDHALFLGGDIWFDGPPPSTRLPFLLVDAGFDVFVAHHRATKYSPDCVNYPRTSFNYWDFTFDELAKYDLPPLMKLVQQISKQPKIHFVGFNQGGMLPLAALASDPSFVKNLASLTMIAPTTFVGNITSPVLHSWGTGFSPDAVFYDRRLVNGEYNLTNTQNLNTILGLVGGNIGTLFGGGSTDQLLNNVTGPNCCVPNTTIAKFGTQVDTNWVVTSYKNLVQYQQEIKSGKFAMYDYGTGGQNERAYNQSQPPSYDLSKTPPTLPIFLVSGENDWFADRKNIQKLKSNLPQDPTFLEVPKYAHFDLVFSENIVADVYEPVVKYLQKGFRG